MCPSQAGSSSSGGKHDGKKSGDPTGSPDNLCLFSEQPLGLSLSRTRVNTLRTITTDNGCEFAAHLEITRLLSLKNREKVIVYFADSYCSWQKGAIENANKLIRKYISKKSNFDDFSDKRIMEIQKKLNRRPREKIDFDTPKKRFFDKVA